MKTRLPMAWLLWCLLSFSLGQAACCASEPSAVTHLAALPRRPAAEQVNRDVALEALRFRPYVSRFPLYASRFTSYASAVPPTIRLEPATSTVQPGTVFTIAVQIDNAVDLGAFEFTLAFSPAALQVERVMLSSFLGSTGRATGALGPTINNQAGSLAFGAFSFGNPAGPNGSGTLALIGWRAGNTGSSALTFSNVQLTDSQGRPQVPVNTASGSVTVAGASPTSTLTATPTRTPLPTASASLTATATATASRTPSPGPSHTATATLRRGRLYLPMILKGFRR